MKKFGYYIMERHLYQEASVPDWTDWLCIRKNFYLTRHQAENAVSDMCDLLIYNNDYYKTEFKIIELHANE